MLRQLTQGIAQRTGLGGDRERLALLQAELSSTCIAVREFIGSVEAVSTSIPGPRVIDSHGGCVGPMVLPRREGHGHAYVSDLPAGAFPGFVDYARRRPYRYWTPPAGRKSHPRAANVAKERSATLAAARWKHPERFTITTDPKSSRSQDQRRSANPSKPPNSQLPNSRWYRSA
jgi:hypothetical protein